MRTDYHLNQKIKHLNHWVKSKVLRDKEQVKTKEFAFTPNLKFGNLTSQKLIQRFWISRGTFLGIKKELDWNIIRRNQQERLSKRRVMNSVWLNKSIYEYANDTNHLFTARDVSTFIHKRHNVKILPAIVRKVFKELLHLSYKLRKSRLVNHNETTTKLMKIIFSIKASKIINSFGVFINIDKSMSSR